MSEPSVDRPDSSGVLHFFRHYTHPDDVVRDHVMSRQDKREMLADWASDRRAVEDHPALRRLDTGELVDIDAVLDALKQLDGLEVENTPPAKPVDHHQLRHLGPRIRKAWTFWKDDDDDDPPPCPAAAAPWKPRPTLDATSNLLVA